MSTAAWRVNNGQVFLNIRLTPKSSKDQIIGQEILSDGRFVLKAKVRAVPEKGAANQALIKLVAKTLSLPKSALHLESGSTARLKTLRIEGEPDDITAALDQLAAQGLD